MDFKIELLTHKNVKNKNFKHSFLKKNEHLINAKMIF